MRAATDAGSSRLHVVAPPGAGKTILGLAWLLEREQRAVVLSPTSTIAAQWVDKFRSLVVNPLYDLDSAALVGSDREVAQLPDVLCLTYQAFSVKERGTDTLHENVDVLFERLIEHGVKTLVLDECHHLLDHWAYAVAEWLERQPDAIVLGLTATPPVDANRQQAARHEALLGPVTYEIPLPAMVRSGHLAPYQDLAWIVRPTAQELAFLASAHERFTALEAQVEQPPEPLFSLRFWIVERLQRIAAGTAGWDSWHAFIADDPDTAIAFGRVANERGIALPAEAWTLDEMEDPPTLDDEATVLADFARGYLLPLADRESHPLGVGRVTAREQEAGKALYETIRGALAPVGFRLTRTGVQRRSTALDRLLGLSAAKYQALEHILTLEVDALQDDLRAVVVVDFERATTSKLVRELDGVLDPEAGGAVSVVRYLASHPRLGALDAVMLTGQSLVCDVDVAPHVADALRAAAAKHGWKISLKLEPSGQLIQLVGAGPDWHSSRYTLLVTELFEQGVTRCLVGTRGLLGEGWDTRSANALVDMTSVAAFVSTNQLRGRCLRLDPERPEKVANLWDVVAIAPHLERGFADWQRFHRKHDHVYGVADDGAIERGVGHVHPAFTHLPPTELSALLTEINADMSERAANRPVARRAWRVGEAFTNEDVSTVEIRPSPQETVASASVVLPPGVGEARAQALSSAVRERDKEIDAAEAERGRMVAHIKQLWDQAAALRRFAAEAAAVEQERALVVRGTAERWWQSAFRVRGPALVVLGVLASLFSWVSAVPAVVAATTFVAGDVGSSALRRRRASRLLEATTRTGAHRMAEADAEANALELQAREAHAAGLEHWRRASAEAERKLTHARTQLTAPVHARQAAERYALLLLDGFRRWDRTRAATDGVHVILRERTDGAMGIELPGADAAFTATFAAAFREFTGPVGDQRYLLEAHVHSAGTLASAVDPDGDWRAENTEPMYVPIPAPFDSHRSGADALVAAWKSFVGNCDLVYTRRGRGAEIRTRHLRKRWWLARTQRRVVWR